MTPRTGQKIAYLFCFVVISIAVSGYFIGLQSPMNPAFQGSLDDFEDEDRLDESAGLGHHDSALQEADAKEGVAPATHYSAMNALARNRLSQTSTRLVDLKSDFDPLLVFTITPEQKAFALALREANRAFNGAPPTIPHNVDQMSAIACAACHTEGAKTNSLRIPKMSHQFLENCLQCHVENNPQHMTATLFRESSFVGLPAPTGGPRAYDGAPPQIPHSTWMRVDCMSCHGFAGTQGIRSTHPWRQNCQQCHAPSSLLDQVQLNSQPQFLPPPTVKQ